MSSIAIVIPTKGRPAALADTLASIRRQTVRPAQVVVSATSAEDIPAVGDLAGVETVFGPGGLCAQRNGARPRLRADIEIVVFLDDDVELAKDYIDIVHQFFAENPAVVLMGGNVIAEGVSRQDAVKILNGQDDERGRLQAIDARSLYGCNMCARVEIVKKTDFDENLLLVGWLEDFDWCVRASKFGRVASCSAARIVHLKTTSGRVSGRRFGYAQIVNPYYLYRKGSIPTLREVVERHWIRGSLSNVRGALVGDPEIDRWGRLRGNLTAFNDVLLGRSDPRRIQAI